LRQSLWLPRNLKAPGRGCFRIEVEK
jgi:hypothetical protein